VARIADEEIERLKKEVDLAELVVRSGVALKKAGRDLVGCCPFHDDGTPSLVVTPAKGLWHCMGACLVGGTAIDWVMRTQGISFRHAVEVLRAGSVPMITPGRSGPVPTRSTARKLPGAFDASAEDQVLLSSVVDYYHATLADSREAMAYLARRKLDDAAVIERFRLGYANRTLGYRLPHKSTKEGDAVRGRLTALGVLRASGHEHLSGSLVVPVITPAGTVTELYGRKVGRGLRAGTPLHLYLPGPHRGVWNEEGLGDEVILCESLLDALSFYRFGFANVTASYGTAGFSADHMSAFERHGVARVLIAYDHDAAGDEAALSLAGDLMGRGVECRRVVFPYGADANEVAVTANEPADVLARCLRAAEWMGTGRPVEKRHGQQSEGDAVVAQGDAQIAKGDDADTEPKAQGDVGEEPPSSSAAVSPAAVALAASTASHDELVLGIGPRRWRVRHIPKAPSPGALRVNVMVGMGERFHVDTLDLYGAKARAAYLEAAATELRTERDVLGAELGRVLLAVEEAQAATSVVPERDVVPPMTSAERDDALALLGAPDLVAQVTSAFATLGVVGEQTAALTWLTLTSRLSDRPLGAVIQSSSAAGKSTLAEAALALMPTEATVAYSAMTGQALYYLGERDLAHKVLSLAEDEGAARASYALKLLVSEGRLSIAAAGKDPLSGRLVTHTYEVAGPVALLMTTTAAELDEELANRLLVLAVDEGRQQTRAVHAAQRDAETLEGLVARAKRAEVIARHANAQRLLSPVAVVNPHAPGLGFSDRSTRHRRDNAKYLGLIRAVALAHQQQRVRKQVDVEGKTVTYIEATEADVALAERLCADVLTSTTDELSPATRNVYSAIEHFAEAHEGRFTRRQLREATGLGDSQLKVHLGRLVDLEYVAVERAGPSTSYALVTANTSDYDCDRPGAEGDRPGPRRDRPGENADRPVIGRFSGHRHSGSNPEVNGASPLSGDLSAGIGRSADSNANGASAQVDDENDAEGPDRPVLRRLHVTGEADPVVVARA
jgi:DNA primase